MIGFKVFFPFFLIFIVLLPSNGANSKSASYIINGQTAEPGQFPFVISLRNRINAHICGACLISNRWVVTAAHCLLGRFNIPHNVFVATGAHERYDGRRYRVDLIIKHPEYNPIGVHNDLGLVRTADDMEFVSGRVQPARLPTTDITIDAEVPVWVAGWGFTKYPNINSAGLANVLHWKRAITITRVNCRQLLGQRGPFVHYNTLCTINTGGKGVCTGDNGTPLVNEQGVFVGLVSWAIECGREVPNVYTRIYPHAKFITQVTGVRR